MKIRKYGGWKNYGPESDTVQRVILFQEKHFHFISLVYLVYRPLYMIKTQYKELNSVFGG